MEPEQENSLLHGQSNDLGSESSSCCSSIVTYDYNPDDFPKACEIEEFQAPSFSWPPSSTSVSRNQSPARFANKSIQYNKHIPKKLVAKLQTKTHHLNILQFLSEAADGISSLDSTANKVASEAEQILHKACSFISLKDDRTATGIVRELDSAINNISDLLPKRVVVLAKLIQQADLVAEMAGGVQVQHGWHKECQDLKSKAERVAELLWLAAGAELYERPAWRIINHTEDALNRAAALVKTCHTPGPVALRVFTNFPANSLKKILLDLQNSTDDICWLLTICNCKSSRLLMDDFHNTGPPRLVGVGDSILWQIWEKVAKLLYGSAEDKAKAAASLLHSLQENKRYGKLVIEEEGIEPLLKLIKEGEVHAQDSAIQVLGLLAHDPESAKILVQYGRNEACFVLIKVLKDGPLEVKAYAASAVYQLVSQNHGCQDLFAQHDTVEVLIQCLLCLADDSTRSSNQLQRLFHHHDEDPIVFVVALCALANGNLRISRTIVDSKLMPLFPLLLEQNNYRIQYNTALLLLEIARVAELDAELRCYAFNPIFTPGVAVVNQLLHIVRKQEYNQLLLPCIEATGCLSKIFWTTEVIGPLVQLLSNRSIVVGPLDGMLSRQVVRRKAVIALTKFTERDNYLHKCHSKAIAESGTGYLARLVYRVGPVQKPALLLACCVASQVPDNTELAAVIAWASQRSDLVEDVAIKSALLEVK